MTVLERLRRLVEAAPRGTLVPVEALAELLDAGETSASSLSDPAVDHTAADVAEMLDRTPAAVRAWCAAGKIPGAYRLNGREWRIPAAALRAYLDAQADCGGDQRPKPAARGDLNDWRRHMPGAP